MTPTNVKWGDAKVKLTWAPSRMLPSFHLITSVHGLCFQDGKLLMIDLKQRGWDFTGGHIEVGETPEQCFQRETLEEGYVEGDCLLLGYIIVDHSENENWREGSKYPKVGYQVFYKMNVTHLHPFEATYESNRRTFIHPAEASLYHHNWNVIYEDILKVALSLE
ncbi:hypothetical conserved protein [Oceanobacillus iheyensis HTE831]|uniref:Hypothetical conserved protein n=1 Tax=Oceanobacillus iheyensis (strain DSM 14371 / CIP 107618 / JCM 11309 / KCTC 3954 / HTE831) TaxID=221109 RepID=Q8ETH5_OCEIH|nr:NUDIX domain-containing protein [Oceanobacillus iheyensis]BAC12242.1 hypothetical conserved protein [Oceanobacillus iheyensis HTE831]